MTKKEFETTDEPLVMIVSFNPKSEKVMHDTYDWRTLEGWLEDFKKDFPDYFHFFTYNPSAMREKRKLFGLNTDENE